MAGEEDVELRDLVAHTLETKGVLGKIRAQLRANVFLALEEQESQQKPHPLVSSKFQQYLKTKDGQAATALVREFLTFFELDYTRSVFDPETNALEMCPGRHQLARDLGVDVSTTSGPLLDCVLQRATQTPTPPNHITPHVPEQLPPLSTQSILLSSAQVTHTTTTTTTMVHPVSSNSTMPTTSMHKPRAGDIASTDLPPPESTKLQHPTPPDNLSPINESPPLHHMPLQFSAAKAETTLEGQQVSGPNLIAGRSTGGVSEVAGVNGRSREINDIFDKKLPSHLDDINMRKMDLGKTNQDPSYQDDFHSDLSLSEPSDARVLASKLDETEDLTMSQNSLADFDYAEPAKT